MGLNLSNRQISQELALSESDIHKMTTQLRSGVVEKKQEIDLSGVVEIDELYVVAGHKGQPEQVKKKGRKARRRRLKGKRGRGTKESEKPPVMGILTRNGLVKLFLLENVKRKTIEPIITQIVKAGTRVNTDEYNIYDWLAAKYEHKRVNHSKGEYARDEDQDGFCEVHVNTIEGFWSLLRSWLRPHRGIFQEKLPYYLAFFEFIHNARKRGKALLHSLIHLLVAT
jgi:transposase-like protein